MQLTHNLPSNSRMIYHPIKKILTLIKLYLKNQIISKLCQNCTGQNKPPQYVIKTCLEACQAVGNPERHYQTFTVPCKSSIYHIHWGLQVELLPKGSQDCSHLTLLNAALSRSFHNYFFPTQSKHNW